MLHRDSRLMKIGMGAPTFRHSQNKSPTSDTWDKQKSDNANNYKKNNNKPKYF